jgi:hypothetical protein
MAIFRHVPSDRYIRLHYENDFFSGSDRYYTQGINLETVHPSFQNNPVNYLLVRPKAAQAKYGLSVEHLGYTPSSISHDEVLLGDRPFASCLFLKAFSIAGNESKTFRISSALNAGVIGPGAGGKQFQESIHRWINDDQPKGWSNQIQNDLVLNYELNVEKEIGANEFFLAAWQAGAKVGTLNNQLNGSLVLMGGWIDNPFVNFLSSSKKISLTGFVSPGFKIVGYDATLQGGIFNNTSPYIVASNDISRFVFQGTAGIVMRYKRLSLEYFRTVASKEFKGAQHHRWGGLRLTGSFN